MDTSAKGWVEYYKGQDLSYLNPQFWEQSILETDGLDHSEAAGRLVVIAAQLLEALRQTDPAYSIGLQVDSNE